MRARELLELMARDREEAVRAIASMDREEAARLVVDLLVEVVDVFGRARQCGRVVKARVYKVKGKNAVMLYIHNPGPLADLREVYMAVLCHES
jgi:plasmid stabilization system protein ParE